MSEELSARRPLRTRDTRWAAALAQFLARIGLRPNQISMLSVLFASLATVAFWCAGEAGDLMRPWLFLAAAANIQLRLLCNLFDGMVAIEGGFKTKSGEIYNELPDRFADALILIGAGYASASPFWMSLAGWLAAVMALITAYVRALGASAGAGQHFCGPMAKPHRMAALTVACLVDAIGFWLHWKVSVLPWCLLLIAGGCVVTVIRRCRRIVAALEAK